MTKRSYRLGDIASELGAELKGNPDTEINGLATLQAASPGQIAFLANPSYGRYLAETSASAVIISQSIADQCPTNALLLDNPYLGYARLSHWFDPAPVAAPGIHPSAVVASSAIVSVKSQAAKHMIVPAAAATVRAALGAQRSSAAALRDPRRAELRGGRSAHEKSSTNHEFSLKTHEKS